MYITTAGVKGVWWYLSGQWLFSGEWHITNLRRHHCVVAKPADEDFIGKYDLPFSIELFKYPHGFFSLVAFIGII